MHKYGLACLGGLGFGVRALVLVQMWTWFVVPFGVPSISFWWALGLVMTATLFASAADGCRVDEGKVTSQWIGCCIAKEIGTPLIILAAGWLYHWWM